MKTNDKDITADSGQDPEHGGPAADGASENVGKDRPREVGGRGGLDPTRYGDWEKAGRCIDF